MPRLLIQPAAPQVPLQLSFCDAAILAMSAALLTGTRIDSLLPQLILPRLGQNVVLYEEIQYLLQQVKILLPH